MSTLEHVVVVGGGAAAGNAVVSLREAGWDGHLTVLAAEPHPPYERPSLSKGVLVSGEDPDSGLVKPASFYRDHDVDLRTGAAALALDVGARTVSTRDGEVRYDSLLLATGAQPRRLSPDLFRPDPSDGAAVAYLRTSEDSLRIRAALEGGHRITVIGGGWIGLEVAAAARVHGCETTVLERGALPLAGVLGATVAQRFAEVHRAHGTDLRTGTVVDSVDAGTLGATVHLTDGSAIESDLVVVGIGAIPDVSLAEHARLTTSDGIVTNARLQTSAPDVYAAGDVASALHPTYRRHLRVEHWDNAVRQGRHAAANILGAHQDYTRTPFFYTDQHELSMEYVGLVGPGSVDDVVIRGDISSTTWSAFWMDHDTVVAAMHVNDWDTLEPIRDLVETRRRGVSRQRLADPGRSLDDVWL
ncbi:NADPH-dependent 2,4-dienoyl-CoA reductase, sulfur reductase [Nocardioides exalbidus]|uniref:NADPH-dependent 2,4-dienoyl-CoA reductase, sulfur reductase n=1 Tax=Nocardioides exalbidus TaxID=402596 RepID=A0A1H4YDV5_9ACTN|nr:FAD/NAD(P)-binding oxidoreductase [Nocardioides exalbidus]SED15331.1 NADPH-dependent 2,4-dienoyl-CoA reductase, sulfur reductase [Nocardioides exalbidus]